MAKKNKRTLNPGVRFGHKMVAHAAPRRESGIAATMKIDVYFQCPRRRTNNASLSVRRKSRRTRLTARPTVMNASLTCAGHVKSGLSDARITSSVCLHSQFASSGRD